MKKVTIKAIIGTHDGNLITNNDLLNRTPASYYDQELIKLEFYNYLGEKISPIRIKFSSYLEAAGTQEREVANEQVQFRFAHMSSSNTNAGAQIINGDFVAIGVSENATRTREIAKLQILELETTENTYTEFVFQN